MQPGKGRGKESISYADGVRTAEGNLSLVHPSKVFSIAHPLPRSWLEPSCPLWLALVRAGRRDRR